MDKLRKILDYCTAGEWDIAIECFRKLDLYERKYENCLNKLTKEELINIAILGYNTRLTNI